MQTLVGTLLSNRYRLDAKVGSGGMSTVYRAFDQRLERPVAIKLMHTHIAADSSQLERFRREARAVAQLSHAHIVGVIDVGEDQGRPYIVLEYVEGQTLKERVRADGPLPVAEAVAYAIEIARALRAAHGRSIVHRDVKPQNVLIDAEGSAKVTDFGIARSLDEQGLTAEGRVLGTTDYVAPEQAMGHEVSEPSDLYALGVVLYEMLVGQVPFRGENQVAVAMQHVRNELPDVRRMRPEVSASLAAIVERLAAKQLDERYVSADEVIADLEEALAIETARAGEATGEATSVLRTLPAKSRRRLPLRMRRPLVLLAVLVAIVAAASVAALFLVDNAERGTGARGAKPPSGTDLQPLSLSGTAAHDYDPAGDDDEHADQARSIIDGDPRTFWDTETYQSGALNKPGVGVYVDAEPGIAVKRLEVLTRTPGFAAEIYGASGSSPPADLQNGWIKLAESDDVQARQPFDLDTAGQPLRYYLIWITKLPPDDGRVEISEVFLFR